MHALSLPTWWIHITSVLEWLAAMLAVQRLARTSGEAAWRWLALAMLPALVSAMCACTWHLYDNTPALRGLVVLQAALTMLGNGALALATLLLWRRQGPVPDTADETLEVRR
ncbi:MAG: DUF2499 domain-containing protein [Cyanobium sp.]|jgi:hypothetical protein|nr:DUF2499 domain-containing protein [Cyanobium sp.]